MSSQESRLPRLTGEVARIGAVYSTFAGGAEQQARCLPIPDLEFSKIVCVAFPLRPVERATSPVAPQKALRRGRNMK